jgi:hypothetical protein
MFLIRNHRNLTILLISVTAYVITTGNYPFNPPQGRETMSVDGCMKLILEAQKKELTFRINPAYQRSVSDEGKTV